MLLTCDDCLEDFEADEEIQFCGICSNQKKVKKPKQFHNSDDTANIWKTASCRGFKSQEEIDLYQIVKHDHKILTGNDLPKLEEKVK